MAEQAELREMHGCSCADWLENIPKVNGPILLQAARNPGWKGYDGKPFIYCPWCGRELLEPLPSGQIHE